MRAEIKALVKDTRAEPFLRWVVKRSRGIPIPFDLVKNEIYDRQASEVLKRVLSPHSNCIDIGCHKGQFLEDFLRNAPRGHHFAFEPIPHLAKLLREKFPSVEVFDVALSDKSEDTTFYIVPGAPALSGLHRREFIRQEMGRQQITVRTERLDSLIPRDTKIDFIKIDVEGAEGLVTSGAMETIARNKPFIVLEHGKQSSAAFGTSSASLYHLLVEQCGLKISLLPDWLTGRRPLTQYEFVHQREWYFLAHSQI